MFWTSPRLKIPQTLWEPFPVLNYPQEGVDGNMFSFCTDFPFLQVKPFSFCPLLCPSEKYRSDVSPAPVSLQVVGLLLDVPFAFCSSGRTIILLLLPAPRMCLIGSMSKQLSLDFLLTFIFTCEVSFGRFHLWDQIWLLFCDPWEKNPKEQPFRNSRMAMRWEWERWAVELKAASVARSSRLKPVCTGSAGGWDFRTGVCCG